MSTVPKCLHPQHPDACAYPKEIVDFAERQRVVFHWSISIFSDTDEFGHVDCDYCGTELWSAYKPELNRRTETGFLIHGYDSSTNLDTLYKAVSAHIPDCEIGHRAEEQLAKILGESQ